jgi:putative ABC transport system permease protein
VLLRYDNAVASTIAKRVSDVAQEVTGSPTELIFLDQRVAQVFTEEQRESRLLLMCAGLALFLSCVGLYGLVSVALKTQVKEIGVRKVLGASTLDVVKTFLSRFSIPVLAANIIAWPVAAYSVFAWIARFPYQLDKIWLLPICLGATVLVLMIAWVTVGALTFKAASTRPVKSLRYE